MRIHEGGRGAQKAAFTLMELLVVIAIIAVLAAMLVPVLAGAKLHAMPTQRINKLQQLQLASSMRHRLPRDKRRGGVPSRSS